MLCGIGEIRAARQNRDRSPTPVEGALMGDGIDAKREPADHGHTGRRKAHTELPRDLPAVGRRLAGADDGCRRFGQEFRQPLGRSREIQDARSIGELLESGRIVHRVTTNRVYASSHEALERRLGVEAGDERQGRVGAIGARDALDKRLLVELEQATGPPSWPIEQPRDPRGEMGDQVAVPKARLAHGHAAAATGTVSL